MDGKRREEEEKRTGRRWEEDEKRKRRGREEDRKRTKRGREEDEKITVTLDIRVCISLLTVTCGWLLSLIIIEH